MRPYFTAVPFLPQLLRYGYVYTMAEAFVKELKKLEQGILNVLNFSLIGCNLVTRSEFWVNLEQTSKIIHQGWSTWIKIDIDWIKGSCSYLCQSTLGISSHDMDLILLKQFSAKTRRFKTTQRLLLYRIKSWICAKINCWLIEWKRLPFWKVFHYTWWALQMKCCGILCDTRDSQLISLRGCVDVGGGCWTWQEPELRRGLVENPLIHHL